MWTCNVAENNRGRDVDRRRQRWVSICVAKYAGERERAENSGWQQSAMVEMTNGRNRRRNRTTMKFIQTDVRSTNKEVALWANRGGKCRWHWRTHFFFDLQSRGGKAPTTTTKKRSHRVDRLTMVLCSLILFFCTAWPRMEWHEPRHRDGDSSMMMMMMMKEKREACVLRKTRKNILVWDVHAFPR